MSRYEEIEAFVRTVEAGSFTAAAEQLRLAKSAISRRVQDLERRLGAQLLIRTTRQLTLTDDGGALFERGKRLLEDWREAEDAIGQRAETLAGAIRLAAPLSFGVKHLGPALIAFQEQHPAIRFDVDFSDRRVDLIAEGIDLAVRIGVLEDSSLIARKLAPIKMIAAASPAYLKRYGVPATPSDLKPMGDLRYDNRRADGWTFTSPEGLRETVKLEPVMIASNGDFLADAAIAGAGVTLQPSFILYEALRDGRLVPLLPDHTLPEVGLYALYPPTRHLSKRIRALVDHLAEHCGEAPYWDDW
ncbi:MAG: LysR family transcriptional regulator [Pseudomonadota bacterium]